MSSCSVVQSSNDCCSIYTGKGTPSSTLGSNGSIFISETSPNWVYKKVAGQWVPIFKFNDSAITTPTTIVVDNVLGQSIFPTGFNVTSNTKVYAFSGGGGTLLEWTKTGNQEVTTTVTVADGTKVIIYEL